MAHSVKRYIDEDTKKVAVLISPWHGAGWSTWAGPRGGSEEIALFDHEIVNAVLNGNRAEAGRIAEAKIPDFYSEGAKQLKIVWVDQGQEFRVSEYDGHEELHLKENVKFWKA